VDVLESAAMAMAAECSALLANVFTPLLPCSGSTQSILSIPTLEAVLCWVISACGSIWKKSSWKEC
jgi:hypothetical protein